MKKIIILLLCPVLAAQSATVTGSLADVSQLALSPRLTFKPVNTPLASGSHTILDTPKTVYVTNGAFSVSLVGGYYDTDFGPFSKKVRIYVPFDDTNTYGFNYCASLSSNVPNFVLTNWSYFISQHLTAGANISFTTQNVGSATERITIIGAGGGASITNVDGTIVVSNAGAFTYLSATNAGGSGTTDLGLLTNNIYYVATSGSDSTGTGSITAPWRTPTNAIAQVTNGTIYVSAGQYQFEVGGKNGVHWYLEPSAILGSTNIIAGPVFTATNGVAFTVDGLGGIFATSAAFSVSGTGEITLNGAFVSPSVNLTNNLTGHWREP